MGVGTSVRRLREEVLTRDAGRELRFGKLTISDADLVLTDMNPSDPLDFYLDHYKDQLVAGYRKTTPAFGSWV